MLGLSESTGIASLTLQPNQIPGNGTCTILPAQGIALETEFRLQCLNWEDADNQGNPLMYWVFAGPSKMIISRSNLDDALLLLPPGEESNDWKLPIEVWVQDSLGAYASVVIK